MSKVLVSLMRQQYDRWKASIDGADLVAGEILTRGYSGGHHGPWAPASTASQTLHSTQHGCLRIWLLLCGSRPENADVTVNKLLRAQLHS